MRRSADRLKKGEIMYLMHSTGRRGHRGKDAPVVLAMLVPLLMLLAASPASAAGALERIKASGKLTLGYGADARPFSYKDESGKPAGYAIEVCSKIADAAKADLGLPALAVDFVPMARDEGLRAVAQGKVDILCEATAPTLTTRQQVSYSIPIFASGIGAVVRKDAPDRLKDILSGRTPPTSPTWRANADDLLRLSTISLIAGTREERLLTARLNELRLIPTIVSVNDYATGVERVTDGRSKLLFGDRAVLLDAIKRMNLARDLEVIDRFFTHEMLAFAVPRDDENLRLMVDAAVSRLFRSNEFRDLYAKWFGRIDDRTLSLFRLSALPE
jgi:ABC-type amino acid transport substrate-binding protein